MKERHGKAFTKRGGAPALLPPPSIRLYPVDIISLTLLAKDGYGYSKTLSQRLNRTQRTVNKHLRKLESVHLIERHGNRRCPFQWYSINERAKKAIRYLISYFKKICEPVPGKAARYLPLKVLFDHARNRRPPLVLQHREQTIPVPAPREYKDPNRPFDRSLPYIAFCKRGVPCPFPICLKMCNYRDKVERSILERGLEFIKVLSAVPP